MMHLDHILASLEGVRETPNGWSACCPAHDDNAPSLSVAEGQDGKVLLQLPCRLHRGIHICEKLGITPADLFRPSGTADCTYSPAVRKSVCTAVARGDRTPEGCFRRGKKPSPRPSDSGKGPTHRRLDVSEL